MRVSVLNVSSKLPPPRPQPNWQHTNASKAPAIPIGRLSTPIAARELTDADKPHCDALTRRDETVAAENGTGNNCGCRYRRTESRRRSPQETAPGKNA